MPEAEFLGRRASHPCPAPREWRVSPRDRRRGCERPRTSTSPVARSGLRPSGGRATTVALDEHDRSPTSVARRPPLHPRPPGPDRTRPARCRRDHAGRRKPVRRDSGSGAPSRPGAPPRLRAACAMPRTDACAGPSTAGTPPSPNWLRSWGWYLRMPLTGDQRFRRSQASARSGAFARPGRPPRRHRGSGDAASADTRGIGCAAGATVPIGSVPHLHARIARARTGRECLSGLYMAGTGI